MGHDLAFSYRKLDEVPRFFEDFPFDNERFRQFTDPLTNVNQLDFFGRWAVTPSWALTYNATYSFAQSLLLSNRGGIEYISKCQCWAVRLQLEDDRTSGITFGFNYTIIGLGQDTIRPFSGGRRNRQQGLIENPNQAPSQSTPTDPATDTTATRS